MGERAKRLPKFGVARLAFVWSSRASFVLVMLSQAHAALRLVGQKKAHVPSARSARPYCTGNGVRPHKSRRQDEELIEDLACALAALLSCLLTLILGWLPFYLTDPEEIRPLEAHCPAQIGHSADPRPSLQ